LTKWLLFGRKRLVGGLESIKVLMHPTEPRKSEWATEAAEKKCSSQFKTSNVKSHVYCDSSQLHSKKKKKKK